MKSILGLTLLVITMLLPVRLACAWDYEGHRIINFLALESLPSDFPRFVFEPAAVERIGFLGGEPDRWRNVQDLTFKHASGPDHYIDIEELAVYGIKPADLPIFRGDFIAQLASIRKENPGRFPRLDPSKNLDHTRELVGLLPWCITENYSKLKSAFSYLKAYQDDGGTAEEISNAQANVIYIMGTMGHFVADAAQPLHTTIHHHGWVGNNPARFTTNRTIHSWIDGGYFAKVGLPQPEKLRLKLRPASPLSVSGRPAKANETFVAVMAFLLEQHKQVQPIYSLEKEGKLSGNGLKGLEGKELLENQFIQAAQCLGDLWFSAWQQAPTDTFLKSQLAKRRSGR